MTKFNVGDKVVPISKTVDWNTLNRTTNHLDKSSAWNKALENEQKYLYVNIIDKIRNLYTCSNEPYGGGDYFHESDLIPFKTKSTKNQRITALEDTVAKQSEEISELKLIVHELRGKKPMEPSTIVEDIIEFEGAKYRKVKREALEGDVVILKSHAYVSFKSNKPYKVFKGVRIQSEKDSRHNGNLYPVYENGIRIPKTVDVYELIKEGLNPHIPIVDETIEPLTPNQQRAAIIEKAKKFVKNVSSCQSSCVSNEIGNETYQGMCTDNEFIINDEKRTVVVLVRGVSTGQIYEKGIAKCNPNDVFNEHIGKAIALGRALGLDVSEFEQAVQPTVAIGQLLGSSYTPTYPTRWKVDDLNDTGKNLTIIDDEFESLNGETADGGYLPDETWYKIVDDTNAKYEEG